MTETKLLELVMIVKNSGEILRRCLIENKKFIDEWTILDTGSTDNTPEIIRETLSDIPGVLHFGDFIDFSTARNKAMDLSKQRCKFMVILDDSYILNGGDKLRKLLKNSKKSCYLINIGKYVDGFLRDSYFSKRIVKTSEKLRYKYRIHEEIHVPNQNKMESIEDKDIFIDDLNFTPHTKRSLNRFSRDIDNLLLDYKDYPNEQRVIYYLGKTYYLLQKYDKAVEYFSKLKYLKHAREDFEFSGWYDTACINYLVSNNIDKLKEELLFITQKFPYRAEAWYKLAVIHNDNGDIEKVNELIKLLMSYPKPKFMGTLFESDIYDYYIPYLFVDTSIKIGNIKEAIYVLKSLLEKYPSDQPLLNIRYSLCDDKPISSIKLSENNKTIVFHTSGECEIIKCWNPNGDMRISGSEFMAMNMAQEFYKLGYRVFIIGTIEDKKIGVNHEGTYKNIEYIDYKYFSEFASKYEIDYLIVSRFTANLTYYYNIKRVYLWIHDVLPIVDDNSQVIQHHKEKFKCIIAVSNWQKNNTMKMLNVPDKSIIVSRNAIYPERFLNKEVVKVPYRFIYTSCPQRGLDNLIKIIPQIKEEYPLTTLYLFVNLESVEEQLLKEIEKLDYVYLHSRLPQEELAIEILKSDIWLYPTDFKETYCITALEMMMAKCLIATVDIAGLGEIIEGKGIVCKEPIKDTHPDLLKKLFFVLERPKLKDHFIDRAYEWAKEQTYSKLAIEWETNILSL